MRRSRLLAVLGSMALAALLAAFVGLGTAGAQVADQSPITSLSVTVGPNGTIIDKGLTAQVPVTITCQIPDFQYGGQIQLSMRQRNGNRIAEGSGYSQFPCNGATTTVLITVPASNAPWKNGDATVDVYTYACGFSGCLSSPFTGTVRLSK